MVCETRLRPKQTPAERLADIRRVVAKLSAGLASGSIKALVSDKGGIAFLGLSEADRDGVTDNCALRRILATGSATAKLAIVRAEQKAGRKLNVNTGHHAHVGADGKLNWHNGH